MYHPPNKYSMLFFVTLSPNILQKKERHGYTKRKKKNKVLLKAFGA